MKKNIIVPFFSFHSKKENSEKNLDNKSILPSSDLSGEGEIKDQGVAPILFEPGSEGLNISPFFLASSKKENLVSKPILPSSNLSQEDRDLIAFYKKKAIRDKKNIAKLKSILAK